MGDPIDPDDPTYPWTPDKYYRVTVKAYDDVTHSLGCDGELLGSYSTCLLGGYINLWYSIGHQCDNGWELIAVTGYSAQELESVLGPFPDYETCYVTL